PAGDDRQRHPIALPEADRLSVRGCPLLHADGGDAADRVHLHPDRRIRGPDGRGDRRRGRHRIAMGAHGATLPRERRETAGSRGWKWLKRNPIVIYDGLAIAYMLIPIVLIIVFSFNDPAGKFNFTWQGFTLSHWAHPFQISELTDALMLSLRLALLATLIST